MTILWSGTVVASASMIGILAVVSCEEVEKTGPKYGESTMAMKCYKLAGPTNLPTQPDISNHPA